MLYDNAGLASLTVGDLFTKTKIMTTHNKLKRWSIVLLLLSGIFVLNACSKGDKVPEDNPMPELVKDTAGKIPGLGNNGKEELGGNPFKLPQGIALEGEIKGGSLLSTISISGTSAAEAFAAAIPENKRMSVLTASSLRSATSTNTEQITFKDIRGSGALVTVVFRLKNTTTSEKTVTFPAGLVIKSNSGKYQNGLLIKKTTYTVPANTTKLMMLVMYCGNMSLSASSSGETYTFAVITNSASLHDLFNRVKNKKINIEQFELKDFETYFGIQTALQTIVWNVTEYNGLTNDNKQWLEKLAND